MTNLCRKMMPRPDFAERYWPKVDKNGPTVRPELGPCWLWTGARDKAGYGLIRDSHGRLRRATHIALELAGWVIPFRGLQVLHLCDNPPCVRPDHLKIGTPQDDADDKVSKGRQARLLGERNSQAKIRQQEANEIRGLYAACEISHEALGQRFGVSHTSIWRIIRGEAWKP
jgi:hypothetical protein